MNWQTASQETGFAIRDKSDGNISIKSADGRQWTISTSYGETYVEEVPSKYHHHANKFDDWRSDLGYAERLNLVGKASKPAPVVERRISLSQQIAQATRMKEDIKGISEAVDRIGLDDESLRKQLQMLVNVAQTLLEIL